MSTTETPKDSVLWGAQAIADAINAPLRQTFHLLRRRASSRRQDRGAVGFDARAAASNS